MQRWLQHVHCRSLLKGDHAENAAGSKLDLCDFAPVATPISTMLTFSTGLGNPKHQGNIAIVRPPSHEEKLSCEPSRISWGRAHLHDCVTSQFSKTFYAKPTQKRYKCSTRDKNFADVRKMLHNNYRSHWSLPLFGSNPKKFNFLHQTVSHQEAHMGCMGTRLRNVGTRLRNMGTRLGNIGTSYQYNILQRWWLMFPLSNSVSGP